MRVNTISTLLIAMFIIVSCGKDNNTLEHLEALEQVDDLEIDYRIGICNYKPSIDENGCCVYVLPKRKSHYYIVDGNQYSSAIITVCEGESVEIELIESIPTNPSEIMGRCQQLLTCTCCDQIEYDISYHSQAPNCCRIEIDHNMPQCVDNKIVASVRPYGLTNEFTVSTVKQTETEHDILICGPGIYPEDATLFIQFKIDEQCKSTKEFLPLSSCH